jgi:hypothetical protein
MDMDLDQEDGLNLSKMWVANFPFRHGFVPKLAGNVGRKIIIIRRRGSHNNNSQLYRFTVSIAAVNQ